MLGCMFLELFRWNLQKADYEAKRMSLDLSKLRCRTGKGEAATPCQGPVRGYRRIVLEKAESFKMKEFFGTSRWTRVSTNPPSVGKDRGCFLHFKPGERSLRDSLSHGP